MRIKISKGAVVQVKTAGLPNTGDIGIVIRKTIYGEAPSCYEIKFIGDPKPKQYHRSHLKVVGKVQREKAEELEAVC